MENERKEKRLVELRDNSTVDRPRLTLIKYNVANPNHMNLKLRKSYGISNLVMIDDEGFPALYESVEHIMEEYFAAMLDMYERLRASKINKLQEEITELNFQHKFIILVINDQIVVFKKSDDEVFAQMKAHEIPLHILDKVALRECTRTKVLALEERMRKKREELDLVISTSANQMWSTRLKEFRSKLRSMSYPTRLGGSRTLAAPAPA